METMSICLSVCDICLVVASGLFIEYKSLAKYLSWVKLYSSLRLLNTGVYRSSQPLCPGPKKMFLYTYVST